MNPFKGNDNPFKFELTIKAKLLSNPAFEVLESGAVTPLCRCGKRMKKHNYNLVCGQAKCGLRWTESSFEMIHNMGYVKGPVENYANIYLPYIKCDMNCRITEYACYSSEKWIAMYGTLRAKCGCAKPSSMALPELYKIAGAKFEKYWDIDAYEDNLARNKMKLAKNKERADPRTQDLIGSSDEDDAADESSEDEKPKKKGKKANKLVGSDDEEEVTTDKAMETADDAAPVTSNKRKKTIK